MTSQFSSFMLINGKLEKSDKTFQLLNPATEELLAEIPDASDKQLESAVFSSSSAFESWKLTPVVERVRLLKVFASAIADKTEELAELLTLEQGKPLADSRTEIFSAHYWIDEICSIDFQPHTEIHSDGSIVETSHEPLGIVAGIVPWNFPVGLAAWKIAPALLAGNTLILKPSPNTPLTTLKLAEIAQNIFPAGVLNIISGSDRLGPLLTAHPKVRKISFTGSTNTGKAIMKSAAENLTRVTLELGGNDPAIVFEDVDIPSITPKLFWAAFTNNGQFCLASKRIYIHENIYNELSQSLATYAESVKVGNGLASDSQLGPLQNKQQYNRIRSLLEESQAENIKFLTGGYIPEGSGYYIPPTIADNPSDESAIVREEAFGPILPLLKFSDTEEVIRRANDSEYGLGASIWSKDLVRAKAVAPRIEAGTVWINTIHQISPHTMFAGHKLSGFGVENGLEGILEYTIPKITHTALS